MEAELTQLNLQPSEQILAPFVGRGIESSPGRAALCGLPPRSPSHALFDQGGSQAGLALLRLGPGEKVARLLSELVPQLGVRESGFVRVRSNLPVLGFELFGNSSSSFLSAVPAQRLVR